MWVTHRVPKVPQVKWAFSRRPLQTSSVGLEGSGLSVWVRDQAGVGVTCHKREQGVYNQSSGVRVHTTGSTRITFASYAYPTYIRRLISPHALSGGYRLSPRRVCTPFPPCPRPPPRARNRRVLITQASGCHSRTVTTFRTAGCG